jgi:hypoxanthine phosphoribosyltransferase
LYNKFAACPVPNLRISRGNLLLIKHYFNMKKPAKVRKAASKKIGRIKIRRAWAINPKSRVEKTEKVYSRKNKKRVIKNEIETWTSQR